MLRETFAYFAVRAINGVLALSTIAILTRILSPEEYGTYALALAAINVCASVLFQWLNTATSRFFAAHESHPGRLLAQTRALFLAASSVPIIVSVGIILTGLWPHISRTTIALIGAGTIGMGLFNLQLQIANAQGKPFSYGLLSASRSACALLFGVLLILWFDMQSTGALLSLVLAGFVIPLILGIQIIRAYPEPIERPLMGQMARYGLPLTLTYLGTMALDVTDRFLLGYWKGPSIAGGYAASYDLAQQTIGVVFNVFFLAGFPSLVRAWEKKGPAETKLALTQMKRGILAVAPLFLALFIGFTPELSSVFLGRDIRNDAAKIMPIIAFAIAVGCLKSYLFDLPFMLEMRTTLQLRITLLMASINIPLNFVLIPILGTQGSAIAALASFIIGASISYYFGAKTNIYPNLGMDMLKSAMCTMGTIAFIRMTQLDLDIPQWKQLGVLAPIRALLATIVFGGGVYALNLCGIRTSLIQYFRHRRAQPL